MQSGLSVVVGNDGRRPEDRSFVRYPFLRTALQWYWSWLLDTYFGLYRASSSFVSSSCARLLNPPAGLVEEPPRVERALRGACVSFLLQLFRKVTHERRRFPWRLESAISFVCKRCFTPSPFLPSSFLFLCSLNAAHRSGRIFTSAYLGRLFVVVRRVRFVMKYTIRGPPRGCVVALRVFSRSFPGT